MKFQNCILISFERTHGRTSPKQYIYCPFNFSKVGGIKTQVEEKAHKVCKNLVCENTTGHDAVSKPRNLKQLHKIRAAKQEKIRLSMDAIYNTHAYAGDFVKAA